ncbi:MAG: hypothetical protein FWH01_11475 [Oscillospiraceae bacterium]|nr:hypothetical protein [Oscillospiraceae bacterium]
MASSMSASDVYGWLMDNADAPIRYRVLRELLNDEKAAANMEAELPENPAVGQWLKNLKPETPPQHWSMEHGSFDFCLENALPKLVQLGLHSGLAPLADAVRFYLDKMKTAPPGGLQPYRNNDGFVLGAPNNGFTSIIISNVLMLAGFADPNITHFMLGSLDEMADFTKKGDCDIYAGDGERAKMKAVPAIWKDKKFIKPQLVDEYGFCYPLIYDIVGLHKLYGAISEETDKKIDAVIDFISTDAFHHNIADGYGILHSGGKKYHSMGWDPKYPGWLCVADYMEGAGAPKLLYFALHISKYPPARKTKWFGDLLAYLENYRTGNGTYVFPAGWLKEQRGYAVQGSHISFGENRKKKNWREIESTFYVCLLHGS